MNLEKIRKDTPCKVIYFNHASTSVPPSPVIRAVESYYSMALEYGATSAPAEKMTGEKVEAAKRKTAELLNADKDEITFMPNGSVGLDVIAKGIPWRKGQNILIDDMSFISNVAPWIWVRDTYGVELRFIPAKLPGRINLDNLEDMVDENTALITITHAANSLGVVQDAEAIGKIAGEKKVLYLLDASGTAGAVKIDVRKIKCDFLAASGRKYLRGPSGSGILYVKKESMTELGGYTPAWNSGVWDWEQNRFDFYPGIECFQYGEKDYPAIFGLLAAEEYLDSLGGTEAAGRRIQELMKIAFTEFRKIPGLKIIGPEESESRAGTFGFVMKNRDIHDIAAYLNENGVGMMGHHFFCPGVCRLFGIDGTARISLHYWSTEEEIEEAVRLLKRW